MTNRTYTSIRFDSLGPGETPTVTVSWVEGEETIPMLDEERERIAALLSEAFGQEQP